MSVRSYIIDDREQKRFLLDREVLVSEDVLRTKEAICPTGVPFRELARFIRAKANPAQEASPALLLPEAAVARPRLGELHVADEVLRPESSRSG